MSLTLFSEPPYNLWVLQNEHGQDVATIQYNRERFTYLDGKGRDLGPEFNAAVDKAKSLVEQGTGKGKKR